MALALVFAACGMLAAQPPGAERGRVLLLDNERVLQGDVERQGDLYVIRGAVGELQVPASKGMAVCASLEDAYKFLSSRANLHDGGERLRLARWCYTNGLAELAIAEAQAALEFAPGSAESKQFLAMLLRAAAPALPPSATPDAPPASEAPTLHVSGDCVALFNTKIQPILMNTCASCHATGRGGSFVLTRPSAAGPRATQANLAAVIQQIRFDHRADSPLLCKALCAHGGAAHPALPSKQAPPFVTLQDWVELLVVQNHQLISHGSPAALDTPPLIVRPVEVQAAGVASITYAPAARSVEMVPSMTEASGSTAAVPPAARAVERIDSTMPTAAAVAVHPVGDAPANPYDPTPFNLMAHPTR